MQKNLFKSVFKLSLIGMFAIGIVAPFSSCEKEADEKSEKKKGENYQPGESNDPWASLVNETPHREVLDVGKGTLTYGTHVYTVKGDFNFDNPDRGTKGEVTFTHIPSGYEEFSVVYHKLLGKTPHGLVGMIPMAMEIYGRNRTTGEKCIRLLCTGSCAKEALTELKQKYNASQYSGSGDTYLQRYLPAAALQGATPDNAYTPNSPYVVKVVKSKHISEKMPSYRGIKIYLNIVTSGGWDTRERTVDVFKPYDWPKAGLVQVLGFPALYTQCQIIGGTWKGLK